MDDHAAADVAPIELDLAHVRAACMRARVRQIDPDHVLPLDAALALVDSLQAGLAF